MPTALSQAEFRITDVAQHGDDRLHGEEQALDVDVDQRVEAGFVRRQQRCGKGDTGVTEEDVESVRAERIGDLQPHALQVGTHPDVGLDRGDGAAQLRASQFQPRCVATGDRDLGALAHEKLSGGEANAAGRAGDQCGFSLQSHGRAPDGIWLAERSSSRAANTGNACTPKLAASMAPAT